MEREALIFVGSCDLAGIVRGTGCQAAVIVTDRGLAGTAVVVSVADALAAGGIPVTVFSEVQAKTHELQESLQQAERTSAIAVAMRGLIDIEQATEVKREVDVATQLRELIECMAKIPAQDRLV